jgi:hypothetical protein
MSDPVQVIHAIIKTWGGKVPENFGSGWKQLREKIKNTKSSPKFVLKYKKSNGKSSNSKEKITAF